MKIRNAISPMYWGKRMIDKRIEQYTKGVGTEMQYNPLLVTMKDNFNDRQLTRRGLENSLWYSGNEQDLLHFYTKEAPKFFRKGQASESTNYFWAQSNINIRRIHSGIPQLICEKMTDLITGNGYNIKVEGKNEVRLQEELDEMLQDNKFRGHLLGKSIETESWSGGVSWKLSWNPTLTEYPIIEAWQPENYTSVIVSGRVQKDIFYIYYEKNNVQYRLSEIYGVDKSKGAYIDYKLEKLQFKQGVQQSSEGKWETVSFNELEQTENLKRIEFNGYYKRLSLYKPNKLPNSEFRYSMIGESDYAGSYGGFDAVDEIISTWIQEFRDGKLNRYFPEEYMLKNLTTGRYTTPDAFKKDHILFADSPSDNVEKQKIQYAQGDIQTDKHVESYKIWVTQILNNAGLSPLTVGITGLEGIDASAESQQEREKVSIRTRNKKIELWVEFLQDILKTALEFRMMTKKITATDTGIYSVGKIEDFDLIVTFNDYIIKSKADRTTEVQSGLGTSWDVLTGVKYVHDDMTLREQLAISARTKIENGYESISQAELSALQAENLDVNEELIAEKVEIIEIPNQVIEPLNDDGTQVEDTPLQNQEVGIEDGKESVEETLLNGAQITSAVSIVDSFNKGVLTFEGALEMLMTFLNIPEDKARKMLNNGSPTQPVVTE